MLRATLKAKPDYMAFVSDAPGPTFRDALYDQYKANRPPMPDDLRAQVEPMLAIVGALAFPILRADGGEAADLIGTLAMQARAPGIEGARKSVGQGKSWSAGLDFVGCRL